MRKLLVAVLVAALAGVLPAGATAATRTIRIGDNWYGRQGKRSLTVGLGARIAFKWVGHRRHSVRVNTGPRYFASPVKRSGRWAPARARYRKVGTYRLICDVRPRMRVALRIRR